MGRLPRTTQSVSLLVFIILAAWISSTLAETAGQRTQRTGKLTKLKKIQVYQGDDAVFRCSNKFKLKKTSSHKSGVQWYQNGNLTDRNIHQRLRFSIRRNTIHIDNVHFEDKGVWAVRYRSLGRHNSTIESSSKLKWRTWCNFTLEVLEDLEALEDSEDGIELLPMDDQMMEKYRQQDDVGRFSPQTRPINPEFRRLERRNPQLIIKRTGESVALKCPVHGYRQYSTHVIDWRKNGEQIVLPKKSGRSLKIEAITKQDSGEYICVISNLNDKSLNFTFQLTVLDVPEFKPKLLEMQNITVRIGDTARLNCSMASHDHRLSTVEWLRQANFNRSVDSIPFHSSPFFEVLDVDYSDGKDRRILSIDNVTHEDDGKYLCLVTNQHGTFVQSSWLIVDDEKQTETLQNWLIVQISTAGAVGGAIVITSIASFLIFIRIKRRTQVNRSKQDTELDRI